MEYFTHVKSVAITQLFASIPSEYKDGFKKQIYKTNMERFSTQCFVLLLMDFCYLVAFLLLFENQGENPLFHIKILTVKILLMLIGYFYFIKISDKYSSKNLIRKNMDVIYPFVHFVLEFLLFYTGPQGIAALFRLITVPLICGGIPIIKQGKAIVLEAIIFGSIYYYLPTTIYGMVFHPVASIVNIWLVVFVCVNLISFIIYSAQVQNYKLSRKEIESRRQVEELLKLDELTKVNNRRMVTTYLDSTWNDKELNHKSLSVIMFDIDYFKALNDTYGHKKGDECLVQIANEVKQITTDYNYELARFGGEEFLVLAYDKEHIDAVDLAEKIRAAVEALKIPNVNSKAGPHVTISLGVSTQTIASAQHYNKIIEWADECLYFAKHAGRNRVAHREDKRAQYRLLGTSSDASSQYSPMLLGHNIVEDFSVDYAFIYYSQRDIMKFSKAAMKLLNLPAQIGHPVIANVRKIITVPDSDVKSFIGKIKDALKRNAPFFTAEFRVKSTNDTYIWIAVSAKCIYNSSDELEAVYGSALNIEKLEYYQNYIMNENSTNPITNLPDRHMFRNTMGEKLPELLNRGYILIFDINDFKALNGFFGHNTGNKVLAKLGSDIPILLKEGEELYHYGPDQFVIVFGNTSDSRVQSIAETVLLKYNSSELSINEFQIDITLTATALMISEKTDINELYIDMDIAIQVAKKNYPREFSFFTEEKKALFLDKRYLEDSLKKAVNADCKGFVLYFQPLVDGYSNICAGAEALLRWINADGDLISPMEIVPVLERTNLMLKVEQWVINEACTACARFISESGNNNFFVNVNLSPSIIGRDSLIDEVMNAMSNNNLSEKNLFFEVTESSPIANKESTIKTLQSLRQMGVRIALDDFGTGFSSLSSLKAFPVDKVKIDGYFVQNSDINASSKALLYAIIQLTKSVGYQTCVEGIETSAHHEILKDKGVDYFQGFYFGKPISYETFVNEHFG